MCVLTGPAHPRGRAEERRVFAEERRGTQRNAEKEERMGTTPRPEYECGLTTLVE